MKNILVILKKELKRFFTDSRMLIAIFLPGLLIFGLYTLMGNLFKSNIFSQETKDTTYKVVYTDTYANDTTNKPKLLSYLDGYYGSEGNNNKVEAEKIATTDLSAYKDKLKNGEYHLIIEFSDKFEDKIYDSSVQDNNINLYYNGEDSDSESLYSLASQLISSAYNNYTQNIDHEHGHAPVTANVAGEGSALANKIIGFVLPMVTVSLLYATIISFCPESISGEKERGTLATVLLTPIKKTEFAIGKIIALSIVAIIAGTVSFIGLAASLPTLIGMSTLPFGFGEIILLLVIIISTLLLFVSFGVLISSLCNSVKEASSYLGPLTVLFMVLGMLPIFVGTENIALAFVPVVNLSMCITALMGQAANLSLLLVITAASNLIYAAGFVFLITRVFNREKMVLGQ